jgi:hypothetical protein
LPVYPHEDIEKIDVLMSPKISRAFNIISPLVEVLDVPGIDDNIRSLLVNSFIDDNLDLMLPVIIFPLIGGVLDTVHFSNLMTKVKPAKKIFVVFTHIENIITGVKHLIREDDEDISGEDLKNEIVQRI